MGLKDRIVSKIVQMALGSGAKVQARYSFVQGQSGHPTVLACPTCMNSDYLVHNLATQVEEPRSIVFRCHGCATQFALKFERLWCSGCNDWSDRFRIKLTRDSDIAPFIKPGEGEQMVLTPNEALKATSGQVRQFSMYGQCLKCPAKDAKGSEIGGASFDFGGREV